MMRSTRPARLGVLVWLISLESAQAAPLIVQNPNLPGATASFEANLDGNLFVPSVTPGDYASAEPLDVAVPVDGVSNLWASGGTTDAITTTVVPSAFADALGIVILPTSNGSASDAAQATTSLEYSVRIFPVAPIANPPTTVPLVLSGELVALAYSSSGGGSGFGRAQASFVAPSIGSGFGRINHSAIFPPRPTAFTATEQIQVGLLYRARVEAYARGVAVNTSTGILQDSSGNASASLGFGFDQARFDQDRATAGLPTFDLESAYRIEVGPPIEAPGGVVAPTIPTGDVVMWLVLMSTLIVTAVRSARLPNAIR